MNFDITYAQFGTRPPVTKPSSTFLAEIGEDGMRKLISKHYDSIKTSDIYNLFPQDDAEFEQAKLNSSDFFIQICGGPAYFNANRGAPMMAKRHAPFAITPKARETWLKLYIPLLEELLEQGVSEESVRSFWNYLDIFSIWMTNTPQ